MTIEDGKCIVDLDVVGSKCTNETSVFSTLDSIYITLDNVLNQESLIVVSEKMTTYSTVHFVPSCKFGNPVRGRWSS